MMPIHRKATVGSAVPFAEDRSASQREPQRLPPALLHGLAPYRHLVHLDSAVQRFVLDGTVPTDPDECTKVASWCLEQNLREHCVAVPATHLEIGEGATPDSVDECLRVMPQVRGVTMYRVPGENTDRIFQLALGRPLQSFAIQNMPDFDDRALQVLCELAQANPTLTILELVGPDLADRPLAFRKGTALALLAESHPALMCLRLKACEASATLPLLNTLANNKPCRLTHLEMRDMWFDGSPRTGWGLPICLMLSNNKTLATLDIRGNPVDPLFLFWLGASLEFSRSLRALLLDLRLDVRDAAMDEFIGHLALNLSLTSLELRMDALTPEQRHRIQELMHRNRMWETTWSRGFVEGAGMGFARALPSPLPTHLGHRIGGLVFDASTTQEIRDARGLAALAQVNTTTWQHASLQRSLQYARELAQLASSGDQPVLEACRTLQDAGVVVESGHLDAQIDSISRVVQGAHAPGTSASDATRRETVGREAKTQLCRLLRALLLSDLQPGPSRRPLEDALPRVFGPRVGAEVATALQTGGRATATALIAALDAWPSGHEATDAGAPSDASLRTLGQGLRNALQDSDRELAALLLHAWLAAEPEPVHAGPAATT